MTLSPKNNAVGDGNNRDADLGTLETRYVAKLYRAHQDEHQGEHTGLILRRIAAGRQFGVAATH